MSGIPSHLADHTLHLVIVHQVEGTHVVAELRERHFHTVAFHHGILAFAAPSRIGYPGILQIAEGPLASLLAEVGGMVVGDSHEVEARIHEIIHILCRSAESIAVGTLLLGSGRSVEHRTFQISRGYVCAAEQSLDIIEEIAPVVGRQLHRRIDGAHHDIAHERERQRIVLSLRRHGCLLSPTTLSPTTSLVPAFPCCPHDSITGNTIPDNTLT